MKKTMRLTRLNVFFDFIVASKLYGVNATIIIFVFVLYCIVVVC